MDKSAKTALITGILVLVLVGAATAYFLSRDTEDTTQNNTTQTSQPDNEAAEQQQTPTIVELASGNDSLSTLVAAVTAADLGETLGDETASFTVFAPTNEAFAALPEGTLDTLLQPENKDQLSGILTYHVVEGAVTSDQLSDGQTISTVNGAVLTVSIENDSVYLVDANEGRAMVSTPDVSASNGVVHIIDSVLLPE